MQENLKDILSHLSTEVDQETLLLYLQGKLSEEQQHEVEKQMLTSDFGAEAMEGLQNFRDKKQLEFLVAQLNRDIRKKTAKKRAAKEKLRLKETPWLLITVLIILFLIVISYIVLHYHLLG